MDGSKFARKLAPCGQSLRGRAFARMLGIGALCVGALGSGALSGAASENVQWGYRGDIGPAHWGALDPAFAACAQGSEQSPVDLTEAQPSQQPSVAFDYVRLAGEVVNNGHTIQVNLGRGSGITVDETRYELVQFHFHGGSEHTVDGLRFPTEMHLVHQNGDGQLAVVGVLLREGDANEALAPVWELMPALRAAAAPMPVSLDLMALLPENRSAWRYAGSLTTPPCTEGVSWLVMTQPVTLSAAQIATFNALYDGNYRPVQPLNDRVLVRE